MRANPPAPHHPTDRQKSLKQRQNRQGSAPAHNTHSSNQQPFTSDPLVNHSQAGPVCKIEHKLQLISTTLGGSFSRRRANYAAHKHRCRNERRRCARLLPPPPPPCVPQQMGKPSRLGSERRSRRGWPVRCLPAATSRSPVAALFLPRAEAVMQKKKIKCGGRGVEGAPVRKSYDIGDGCATPLACQHARAALVHLLEVELPPVGQATAAIPTGAVWMTAQHKKNTKRDPNHAKGTNPATRIGKLYLQHLPKSHSLLPSPRSPGATAPPLTPPRPPVVATLRPCRQKTRSALLHSRPRRRLDLALAAGARLSDAGFPLGRRAGPGCCGPTPSQTRALFQVHTCSTNCIIRSIF